MKALWSGSLTGEATLDDDEEMADYFRIRGLTSGLVAGAVAAVGVSVLTADAPSLFDGLTSPRGIVLMVSASAVSHRCGSCSADGSWQPALPPRWRRWLSSGGEYPWVLGDSASIEDYAASHPVLWALTVAFLLAGVLVLPSLIWLFRLTQTRSLGEGDTRPNSTEALRLRGPPSSD